MPGKSRKTSLQGILIDECKALKIKEVYCKIKSTVFYKVYSKSKHTYLINIENACISMEIICICSYLSIYLLTQSLSWTMHCCELEMIFCISMLHPLPAISCGRVLKHLWPRHHHHNNASISNDTLDFWSDDSRLVPYQDTQKIW